MRYNYNVRMDFLDTDEARYIVYGIDVTYNSGIIKSVSNLFCNRESAENFVSFCRSQNLSPESVEAAAAEILDSTERNFEFTDIRG